MSPRAVLLLLPALLAGCGALGDGAGPSADRLSPGPTVPVDLDRSCDRAPYPSTAWSQCEAGNFAKANESLAEQRQPALLARQAAQTASNLNAWAARAAADPSWLDPRSGNTPVLPVCASWNGPCLGDPFRYPEAEGADGAAFYRDEAEVTPVVFYDRDCARLSGRLWLPRAASAGLPVVLITNGSVQASETLYWWAAQRLVRGGYAVMTYDPRGQGRSDLQAPGGQQGSNVNARVFWEGQVDAIDFLHSTPEHPYPHGQRCAGTYPTAVADHNPAWQRIDRARLGIAGHSLGAIGVAVVQGYGAPGAEPWPGLLDGDNPVRAAVAWDSLINPDGSGFAPADNAPLPPELVAALLNFGTQGNLPAFGPRAPTLSFHADYGLFSNLPYLLPPDPERHLQSLPLWQAAGVPLMSLSFQGSTHLDFSPGPLLPGTSWCPDAAAGQCSGGWGLPAISHYTLAWFDRWLKRPGEPGYADADQRLLDDAGPDGAVKMSFRYRSARDYPDRSSKRQLCRDIRAGCG